VLTIKDLETASGLPRTTIYAYLRRDLLPRPQKTAINRCLYTEEHVQVLAMIAELKRAGLSQNQIKAIIEQRMAESNGPTVDLAAQERESMHRRILAAAAQEIATKGYRETHVSALARKLGITTNVFYEHFASKRSLLFEVYTTISNWISEYVASRQAVTTDPGERALWSTFATFRLHELGPSAIAEIRVEGTKAHGELPKPINAVAAAVERRVESALGEAAMRDAKTRAVPLELIAYSLIGALEEIMYRASWDSKYSREDLLRAHLWVFLAVHAGLAGKVDIDLEVSRYEELIKYLASHMPPVAPILDSTLSMST
jgi:AcrR family transcriptional regulator